MAIAHVCLQCGWDLAHVHPCREPHYGLAMVQCPRCGHRVVRAPHPLRQVVKRLLRFDAAATALVVQSALVGWFTVASVTILLGAVMLGAEWTRRQHAPDWTLTYLGSSALVCVLLGAWLRAGLGHLSRVRAWAAWLAWMVLVLCLVAVLLPMPREVPVASNLLIEGVPRAYVRQIGLGQALMSSLSAIVLVAVPGSVGVIAMLAIGLAGIPIGRGLAWVGGALRRARWRWRRRRRRLAAAAT